MKKIIRRILILFFIFVVALVGFTSFMNEEKTDSIEEMKAATLPILYMEYEGILINQMFGYKQEMQVNYFRDTITPLDTTRVLTVVVKPFKQEVKRINYEIRTSDTMQVVENGKITNLKAEGEYLKGEFKIQNPIIMNQEYTLVYTLESDGEKVNYYTRLLQRAGINIKKYLEFVQDFYVKSTDKNSGGELMSYLEPDDSTYNSSFTEVNIHSSQSQITWGNLTPQIYRKGVPAIKDINETTASIGIEYMLSSENTGKQQELYYVDEFYRMRNSQSRVMLLDFERSAKQLFDAKLPVMTTTGINLGVTDKEVSYTSNKSGDIVAFVQQGELWSYNKSASKLSRIFSFRKEKEEDERNDYYAHDIKIVRVEENGEIDFVVYGYNNRGNHEGESGIGVYHYYSEKNAVEERIFIPLSKSFAFLKRDLEMLSYVNKQNKLFLYLEENLYEIDLQNKSYKVVKDTIQSDCFVIAKNQNFVAWMDQMTENDSTSVTIMDFESGETKQVKAINGERIKALGFMNDDFVYGLARADGIVKDPSGNVTFGMYTIKIEDFSGTLKKEYSQDNVWIPKVSIEDGLIELSRVVWENNQYVAIANDHIMNNQQQSDQSIEVKASLTNSKGRQISLIFKSPIKDKKPLVTYSKMKTLENVDTLNMRVQDKNYKNVYYVYSKGKLDSIWTRVNDAVKAANEGVGIVMNGSQQYIWERGNQKSRNTMNVEDIPEAMLTGVIDEAQLQTSLVEGYIILNYTGCTLDQVLYQISEERPVVVKISDTETRIIVGYDMYNTWLYNPETKEVKPYGMNDSKALFETAGNVFVSYIESLPSKTIEQIIE